MQLETYIQFAFALVFVLALVGLLGLVLRRMGYGGPALSRGRQRRLSVVEVVAVDAKRRLVLVRRDEVEHLLLLGVSDDLVVERGIAPPDGFRDAVDRASARPAETAAGRDGR